VSVVWAERSAEHRDGGGEPTFTPGSAGAYGLQFWVDPANAMSSIVGSEGEAMFIAGITTFDNTNATVLEFSDRTPTVR